MNKTLNISNIFLDSLDYGTCNAKNNSPKKLSISDCETPNKFLAKRHSFIL